VTEFDLPPRRSLPPEVRERMRPRLGERPASSRSRLRVPLAAAAGVAVLATAAIVVTQYVGKDPVPPAPAVTPPPGLDVAKADAELDRCWAAVRSEHAAAKFPPRETWVPVLYTEGTYAPDLHVTGAIADGKPLFCQTTATTATVTDPTKPPGYVEGSRTGSLLASDVGVLAGVVDPSWPHLFVDDTEAEQAEGLFLLPTGIDYSEDRDIIVSKEEPTGPSAPLGEPGPGQQVMPRPARPAVVVTDRPPATEPERDSPSGQVLGTCLAESEAPVVDPDTWQPGAMVEAGASHVVMARGPNGVGRCEHFGPSASGSGDFYMFFDETLTRLPASVDRPTVMPLYSSIDDDTWVAVGALPENAATLTLTLGNGDTVDAEVALGTFATRMPPGVAQEKGDPTSAGTITSARVLDANGSVIYEGPVAVAN
jgi:hypothetical protein